MNFSWPVDAGAVAGVQVRAGAGAGAVRVCRRRVEVRGRGGGRGGNGHHVSAGPRWDAALSTLHGGSPQTGRGFSAGSDAQQSEVRLIGRACWTGAHNREKSAQSGFLRRRRVAVASGRGPGSGMGPEKARGGGVGARVGWWDAALSTLHGGSQGHVPAPVAASGRSGYLRRVRVVSLSRNTQREHPTGCQKPGTCIGGMHVAGSISQPEQRERAPDWVSEAGSLHRWNARSRRRVVNRVMRARARGR